MGIRIIDINFLLLKLKKKKYKNILILGYQDIYFNHDYLNFLKKRYFYNKYDDKFDINNNNGQIDCLELFKLLSDKIDIMDVSSYEGANLVYDLSSNFEELPKDYRDKYELILDWGTSEHVFNIVNCYLNINAMLASGGEYVCLTPMNSMPDHGYYQISPNFYFDFFSKIFGTLSINMLQIQQIHTPGESWKLFPYQKNCIDHLVNGGIDNEIYFNFIQGIKGETVNMKEGIYQYQFVEHWEGKRQITVDKKEQKGSKWFFLGFEFFNYFLF